MEFIILLFLVVMNGLFAMSEIAVVSSRKARLQQWANEGKAGAGVDYWGIKVDKGSACEGVWLDAGELDAVAKLEKSVLDGLFSVFKR